MATIVARAISGNDTTAEAATAAIHGKRYQPPAALSSTRQWALHAQAREQEEPYRNRRHGKRQGDQRIVIDRDPGTSLDQQPTHAQRKGDVDQGGDYRHPKREFKE